MSWFPSRRTLFVGLPFLLCCWFFLVARALDRDLNHDEHQFLAPAALVAREGLLPYRDFPLFHLPNLTFLYAALERLTGEPILTPKLASAAASGALVALVFFIAASAPVGQSSRWRYPLAMATVLLLLFDPVFTYTAGKTWSHELPTALAVGAFLLVVLGVQRNSLVCNILAGLFLGLAIGTRLTFAPLALPLLVGTCLVSAAPRRRLVHATLFSGAALVALAPSLYFYCTAREAFLFANFEFPRLRLLDVSNTRIQKTVTWWRKLRFFFKEVALPSLPLFLTFAALAVKPGLDWFHRPRGGNFASALLLLTLPFPLLGCFSPSRYQYQHYFVLIPFLALGVALSLQASATGRANHWRNGVILAACLTSFFLNTVKTCREAGVEGYEWIANVFRPDEWFSHRAAAVGQEIRAAVPAGKVLTLAPTWPLAGGLPIYPEFATGVFAWRSAALLPEDRRHRLKLVAPNDLDAFLATDPPGAILTGVEDDALEAPLIAYAQAHGYRPIGLRKRRALWLPPPSQTTP